MTRATATLLGAAAAGFLIWVATQVGDSSTGGYWAGYGIVAGAGLVIAVSQLLGGWTKWGWPRLSGSVLLFAFVPTLIVVGWVFLAHQPHGNWFRHHTNSWSSGIGILSVVRDLGDMLSVLAFGLGLLFGLTFDTAGPRAPVELDRGAADEPVLQERGSTPVTTTRVGAGVEAPPQQEGPPA